jgi:hypothetical protein
MQPIDETHYAEICKFHLKLYRYFLLKIRFNREGYGLDIQPVDVLDKHEVDYMIVIETALEQLTHDEYTILYALYVENKALKDLIGLYSSSTIHRIKPRAIRRFLHCLHN